MKYIQVTNKQLGVSYTANLDEAIGELRAVFECGDMGDVVVFKMIEMPQEEYDSLPEFDGF